MDAICKIEAKPGLALTSVAEPEVGAQDVLIRILQTAICGTDLHIAQWDTWAQKHVQCPLVIGHEFVGEIAALGADVYGFAVGERVTGEGHITCAVCQHCRVGKRHLCNDPICVGVDRPGCFAEYIAIPASNVCKVPEFLSLDVATILDPLGNAAHAALSCDLVGRDVLITGAGPIGVMAAKMARHAGARHVLLTDVAKPRLQLAAKCGCIAVHSDAASVQAFRQTNNMINGFSAGMEMSGHADAFNLLISQMAHGGSVTVLGFLPDDTQIPWSEFIFKSLSLQGIYGRKMFSTWHTVFAMLEAGLLVEDIITHRMPYQEFETAFDLLARGEAGKIILQWG